MVEPAIALRAVERDRSAVTVRVNFGVFAGRQATPAEIDELARLLANEADEFTIVAEERHEFGGAVEASLRQVRIEIGGPADLECDELADRVVEAADGWARACVAERSVEVDAF
jgi:hypothetical protein